MLRLESGKSFDKDYIDNEVAYHKAAIEVENVLIPDATNSD